jgi:hypothetical protein
MEHVSIRARDPNRRGHKVDTTTAREQKLMRTVQRSLLSIHHRYATEARALNHLSWHNHNISEPSHYSFFACYLRFCGAAVISAVLVQAFSRCPTIGTIELFAVQPRPQSELDSSEESMDHGAWLFPEQSRPRHLTRARANDRSECGTNQFRKQAPALPLTGLWSKDHTGRTLLNTSFRFMIPKPFGARLPKSYTGTRSLTSFWSKVQSDLTYIVGSQMESSIRVTTVWTCTFSTEEEIRMLSFMTRRLRMPRNGIPTKNS